MKISEILKGKENIDGAGSSKITVIGNNSQFNGNITFTGILKISGTIKGNIETTEDADVDDITQLNIGVGYNF